MPNSSPPRLPRRGVSLARWSLVALLLGCNSGTPLATHPVTGKVVLANGKPLTSGTIHFEPIDAPALVATAKLQSDGTFTLKSPGDTEGAAEGRSRVYIVPDPATVTKSGGRTVYPFPAEYMDEETSPLTITVKPGANELNPSSSSHRPHGPSDPN